MRTRQDGGLADAVLRQERRLLGELAALAVVSVGAGVAVRRLVRRQAEPVPDAAGPGRSPLAAGLDQARDAARQAVAWGVVDLAIAGWGVRGLLRTRRDGLDDAAAAARARRLALVVGANAVLDVGYVAAGAALAAKVPARRGDGVGVVLSGLALLRLDLRHAAAFRGLSSPVRDRRVGGRT